MHERREQLEAVDQARARPAEVRGAVDHPDLPALHGGKVRRIRGIPGRIGRSRSVRATSKPQHAITSTSGAAARTSSHTTSAASSPARPTGSMPPAIATSSGPQWPLRNGGVDPLEQHAAAARRRLAACAHALDAGLRAPPPRLAARSGTPERGRRRGGCPRTRRRASAARGSRPRAAQAAWRRRP